MSRNYINLFLIFPFFLFLPSQKVIYGESKSNIDKILKENGDKVLIDYEEIENAITKNNPELKSLDKLISSAAYNLSSKISKRYPTIDLNANGIPKYLYGENYNSNSSDTKSSQFSLNPSLTLKLDLIDPQRGPDIKTAKDNYKIAKNNYKIKRRDLIKEARSRYHEFQKSYEEVNNRKISLNLSSISLKDAESKFNAGILS